MICRISPINHSTKLPYSRMSRPSKRTVTMWRTCLESSFRTSLACAVVGCATMYIPDSFHRNVPFTTFSYLTSVLIVTDATLGDTWHGCWCMALATAQTIGPAMVSLYLIGPSRLSWVTMAIATAVAAFAVVVISRTHVLCKRIALGQIVLVYVTVFIKEEDIDPIMHPVNVAASTALGALAATIALLLPFSRLATYEVRRNREAFMENALERLKLCLKAAVADDKSSAMAVVSQSELLAAKARENVHLIELYQGSAKWETLPFKLLRKSSDYARRENPLEEMFRIHLGGMEMALMSASSLPMYRTNDYFQDHKTGGHELDSEEVIKVFVEKCTSHLFGNNPGSTITESILNTSFESMLEIPTSPSELSSIFFLFCLKLLHRGEDRKEVSPANPHKRNRLSFMLAFKYSISLGLAVLFGLAYSHRSGFWAGLLVAISFTSAREPTFTVANARVQGTVLGTVYGVIAFAIFHNSPLRLISIVPWLVFSSLLMKSRMYGRAGGMAAAIGAVLILGRRKYGLPREFAIGRIVETFIGLSCLVVGEILFGRPSASSMAKTGLSSCFKTLNESVVSLTGSESRRLECLMNFRKCVHEFSEYVDEAVVEPSFWFLPFNGCCYKKLQVSLSKLVDLMHFQIRALGILNGESGRLQASSKDMLSMLSGDVELFGDLVKTSTKGIGEISRIESIVVPHDEEAGEIVHVRLDVDEILVSYLNHSRDLVDGICQEVDGVFPTRSELVMSLSSIGHCMKSFIKEIREMEKVIGEIRRWENVN